MYRKAMYKTYTNNDEMMKETYELSRATARYEVSLSGSIGVCVKVRCYQYSNVYLLCKRLGYDYK